MIESLDNYLISIAIGIRFRANFTIEDQIGRITDTILYSKGSFFNPTVFPGVLKTTSGQQVLINEITQDRLVIDNSNIILQVNYGEELTFKGSDTHRVIEEFDKQIIKGILKEFSITEFVRVGYIRRYIFSEKDLIDTFIKRTAGEKLRQVNDMNLRFSKKIPLLESLTERDTYDYENAIFNIIKKADLDNEIFMAIDYQRYYNPHLSQSTQIRFKPFLDTAIDFNNNHFLPWLNSYYLESENE